MINDSLPAAPTVHIDGRRLAEARERVSLSRAEAARLIAEELKSEQIGFSSSRLSDLELGRDTPTLPEAEAMAMVYVIPFVGWFGRELPEIRTHDYRLVGSNSSKPLSYASWVRLHDLGRLVAVAEAAAAAIGAEREGSAVPSIAGVDPEAAEDVETAATKLRAALGWTLPQQMGWKGTQEALDALVARLEVLGISVFFLSLPLDEIRGVSRWQEGGIPAIMVNQSDARAAQLFTLAHEFVHLTLHADGGAAALCDPRETVLPGSRNAEAVANRVAAALLVPADALRMALPSRLPAGALFDWPQSHRRRLNRVFHVSTSVLAIRLYHLGLTPRPKLPRSFWRLPQESARGVGMSRSASLRRLLGSRTLGLAKAAVEEERISCVTIARILGERPVHVEAALSGK
jgi:Zn-dependent peptidase ImmA (M78 family)/transcriptional regulator with XRE-family HTH domain